MKRRHLIGWGAGAAGATALGACAQRQAASPTETETVSATQPSVEWRMAASWPNSLDILLGAAQRVCDRTADLTGGRFTIELFPAGEIVPGLQVLDGVQSGAVECGHTASYYYVGKNSALAFGTAVPFGLNAQQQNAWFYQGGGLELMQALYAELGVINFPAGNTGTQMGGWFKQEVNSLQDLQGLKMRIPGLGGEVMDRLGVTVQVLPGGETYIALERGIVDAAEWVGPYDDEKLGLHEAAQFYYYPGWWEPGASLEVQVNLNAWETLPVEYQDALKTACYEANLTMLSEYEGRNGAALQRLLNQGVELKPYSQEILMAAEAAAFDIYEEKASENASFKQVYDQWKAFRDEIFAWNRINELQYLDFANRASP